METPSERECRANQKEELRSEEGPIQQPKQTAVAKPPKSPRKAGSTEPPALKSQKNVQLLMARNRILQEIQETTEREKELQDAGKIQTTSMDAVDSKVIRIGDITESDGALLEHIKVMQNTGSPTLISMAGSSYGVPTPSPRRFTLRSGKIGIMERILAFEGKHTRISTFTSPSSSPSANGPTNSMHNHSPVKNASTTAKFNSPPPAKVIFPAPTVIHGPIAVVDNHQVSNDVEPTENSAVPHRRGWMSAEDKIQEELKQMKVRKDELRLQGDHIMTESQPNLLSIIDESEEWSLQNDDDNEKMPSLYSTLSNPNLLDLDGDTPVKENDISQDQVSDDDEPTLSSTFPIGRGLMSAKKRIQEELRQLKVREDELRLQQTCMVTPSQPNILNIMDEPEEMSPQTDDDNKNMLSLYGSISNPKLLDIDDDLSVKEEEFSQDQLSQGNACRIHALIAHWESKIQQNTDQ